jgi:hypothetical protein
LVATGALLQSVKEESRLKLSSNKTNRGYQITVFTDNEIARFAENPPKRRRIFGLNSRDLRTILNAIENQFLDNLKG